MYMSHFVLVLAVLAAGPDSAPATKSATPAAASAAKSAAKPAATKAVAAPVKKPAAPAQKAATGLAATGPAAAAPAAKAPECKVPVEKAPASANTDAGKATDGSKAQQVKFTLNTVEEEIVEKTNAERKQYGLAPLAVDPGLLTSARAHATWMTRTHTMQHSHANVGENIAMGQRSSTEAMHDWMHSPGHRANILNRGYRRIGVGAFTAKDGTIFWCQQFFN